MLHKKWFVYDPRSNDDLDAFGDLEAEDLSIFTEDKEEVLGCSEWLRCEKETLFHIVKLHNESLKKKLHDKTRS